MKAAAPWCLGSDRIGTKVEDEGGGAARRYSVMQFVKYVAADWPRAACPKPRARSWWGNSGGAMGGQGISACDPVADGEDGTKSGTEWSHKLEIESFEPFVHPEQSIEGTPWAGPGMAFIRGALSVVRTLMTYPDGRFGPSRDWTRGEYSADPRLQQRI